MKLNPCHQNPGSSQRRGAGRATGACGPSKPSSGAGEPGARGASAVRPKAEPGGARARPKAGGEQGKLGLSAWAEPRAEQGGGQVWPGTTQERQAGGLGAARTERQWPEAVSWGNPRKGGSPQELHSAGAREEMGNGREENGGNEKEEMK